MKQCIIPDDYKSALNLHETQIAIKTVKDFFQSLLAERLNLLRVSAPLFVDPASGLNDNLNVRFLSASRSRTTLLRKSSIPLPNGNGTR